MGYHALRGEMRMAPLIDTEAAGRIHEASLSLLDDPGVKL